MNSAPLDPTGLYATVSAASVLSAATSSSSTTTTTSNPPLDPTGTY